LSAGASRRETLQRAALGAAALAAGGLLGPARAIAQSPDDEDLRDFIGEAIALEQIGVLAYALAIEAKGVDAELRRTLEGFRDQEQAHADALSTAIESLGFDPSDAPEDPEDSGVYEDADGIDDDAAARLADLLGRLGEPKDVSGFTGVLLEIEREQIRYYLAGAPGLDSEDLATTSAEIAANQAQHVIVLEREAGTEPVEAMATVEAAIGGGPDG
jgi:rubrerythrin